MGEPAMTDLPAYVPEKVDDTAAQYRAAVDALILAALEGDPDA